MQKTCASAFTVAVLCYVVISASAGEEISLFVVSLCQRTTGHQ